MVSVPSRDPIRAPKTRDKLRKVNGYNDLDEDRLAEEADRLTNPAKLEEFFSHLYDVTPQVEDILDEGDAFPDGFQNRTEEIMAREQAQRRRSDAAHLPVYMYLSKLQSRVVRSVGSTFANLLRFEYGPLHVALELDGVIVEWNDSSLVIPQHKDTFQPIFRTGLHKHHRNWLDFVTKRSAEMDTPTGGDVDYGQQITFLVDLSFEKKRLVDQLIKVIARYNKYYSYDVFTRNCQHFVIEAMAALGVTEPLVFTGEMRYYFDRLRNQGNPYTEFATHQALDTYVSLNKTDLSHDELEFLLCQCFSFHVCLGLEDPLNWSCGEQNCQMQELETRLASMERESILSSEFKGRFFSGRGATL